MILDFSGIDSQEKLHLYLKKKFSLPEDYGCNMDALWDCLYCNFDQPTVIHFKNITTLSSVLPREANMLYSLFQDLHNTDRNVSLLIDDHNEPN